MSYINRVKSWNSPSGRLLLERFPFGGERTHQAWDTADDWLLRRLADTEEYRQDRHTVITGEAFGVLGTALGGGRITAVSDSLLSLQALEHNRSLNPEAAGGVLNILPSTAELFNSVSSDTPAGRIIIRLPKSLDLLSIYIGLSLHFAAEDTEIWLGGMDKRWSRGVKTITDEYFTNAEVFPFERHARWIRFNARPEKLNVQPAETGTELWELEDTGLMLKPAPAVFSAAGLDPGTAAFLRAFPEREARDAGRIADMGCGSGILGLTAAALNPEAKLVLSDESYLAVKAAAENARINGVEERTEVISSNGLTGVADQSIDLVLCNPPFHYQNIQTLEPARFMFGETKRVLKPGGTIQIVGNSHLGYHKHLKSFFPDCCMVYRDSKFTVMRGRSQA